ncbi:MAG TPA: hypothetical protein VHX63_01475 [Acidobacteriaceae bacterium]|nr:hypothetical protein [Acidobacteriaceae bacterium]
MNKQQLQTARLQLWSQNGAARLTLDDVRAWLEMIGFCPVAPLRLPGNPPTPTLVEACAGKPLPEPTLEERAPMQSLLTRLVQTKAAVPLLLISPPGEQPDFVANLEALPFLYAMRGDRDWKAQPAATGQGRVSQLALHCWQELDRNGPQTLSALQRALGSEVTQAAVLRALCELWGHLRVYPQLPVEDADETGSPVWELLVRKYPKQVSIGSAMGQQAALSGILSLYLGAVIAASDDEIVAFLSPLASQSRTREMVHGLTATRQLGRIPFEGGMLLHLKDGLPAELLVDLTTPETSAGDSTLAERPVRGPIRKWEPRPRPARVGDRPFAPREDRKPRLPRESGGERRSSGENAGWKRPEKFAAKKFETGKFEAGKFGKKPFHAGERPAFRSESGGSADRPSADRPFKKPFKRFDTTSRPANASPARDFGGARPQKPWQRPTAAEQPEERRATEGFKKRSSGGPKFRTGGFDPTKPRSAKPAFSKPAFSKPGASKFRTSERPAFRQDAGDGQARPFKKSFAARPPRRDFAAAGEQATSDQGSKFVRRDGAPQDRTKRAPSSRVPSSRAPSSRPSGSKGGWQTKAKPDWKKGRPAAEGRRDDVPRRDRPAGSDAKWDSGKPAAGKFGRNKAGSSKPRPAKHAARKAAAGKPEGQDAARKKPFWAKPMNPKRKKKHD